MSVYAESFFESRLGTLVLAAILGASLFWIFFPTNPSNQQEDTSEETDTVARNFPRYDMGYHVPPEGVRARVALSSKEELEISRAYHTSEDRLLAQLERKYGNEFRYWTELDERCPWQLGLAILRHESRGDPNAYNPTHNDTGLMQIIPKTAAYLGIDPRDPSQSIYGGVKYICRDMIARWQARTIEEVAIGYNAGPDDMLNFRYYRVLPPKNPGYAQKITNTYLHIRKMFDS